MTPIPYSAEELIAQLDEMYPERCPDPKWTERQVWIAVGQRQLVRNLLARLAATQEDQQQELQNVLSP